MTPLVLWASVCGAVTAAAGLWLLWALTTPPGTPAPATLVKLATKVWTGGRRSRAERRRYRLMLATSAAAGIVTWLVSGLPALGLVAAAAVPAVPWLLAAAAAERRAVARVEATADWTRRLRDVAATGTGLQAAITSTAATAPTPIAEPVATLTARLQAGGDTRQALLDFADEINDPACDQVVAALLRHLADRGDKLGTVLTSIADAAAREVSMRKEADAERAAARVSIKFMVGFAAVALAAAAASGDYMTPYQTPAGQAVLAVLAAGFAATLWWVRALTRPVRVPRLLTNPRPHKQPHLVAAGNPTRDMP